MLQELYIDNYQSLVNCLYQPAAMQLLLGENGSGKTSVFNVLEKLRDVVTTGLPVTQAFPVSTLTTWDKRNVQTFELHLSENAGRYDYRMQIEHDRALVRSWIQYESLMFDGQRVYEYENSQASWYHTEHAPPTVFPFDNSRTALSTIPEGSPYGLLNGFRDRMKRIYFFSPDPLRMSPIGETELAVSDRGLHQFASWLRHLTQESSSLISDLQNRLADGVLPGLLDIRLERVSERARILKFRFQHNASSGEEKSANPYTLSFEQLSDGQRCLVALYTILCAAIQSDTTICLDEPDNFIALREIQPLLTAIRDRTQDCGGQCLMISHHPELMNYLAAQHGVTVFREDNGPTRFKKFEWSAEELLTPAELVARGWK